MTRYAILAGGLLLAAACGGPPRDHYADSPTVAAPARSCIYLERTYPDGAVITPTDQPTGTEMRCVNGYWERHRAPPPPPAY